MVDKGETNESVLGVVDTGHRYRSDEMSHEGLRTRQDSIYFILLYGTTTEATVGGCGRDTSLDMTHNNHNKHAFAGQLNNCTHLRAPLVLHI